MPLLDNYKVTATVQISVESSHAKDTVVTYEVTRTAEGQSASGGQTPPANRFSDIVEQAVVAALAAERALRAGAANSEARRLK